MNDLQNIMKNQKHSSDGKTMLDNKCNQNSKMNWFGKRERIQKSIILKV